MTLSARVRRLERSTLSLAEREAISRVARWCGASASELEAEYRALRAQLGGRVTRAGVDAIARLDGIAPEELWREADEMVQALDALDGAGDPLCAVAAPRLLDRLEPAARARLNQLIDEELRRRAREGSEPDAA